MNKYATGSYQVVAFDRYGTKIETLSGFPSLTEAQEAGQDLLNDPYKPALSIAVLRVIRNSLDTHQPYHIKEDEHD